MSKAIFVSALSMILLLSCEAPLEQADIETGSFPELQCSQCSDDGWVPEERADRYLKIKINDFEQELDNTEDFVGCNRTYGSNVLDINISGNDGLFLGKGGKFEISLPLVKELGDKDNVLFSDAFNPIGMPIIDFIADDAPSEFIELPIGLIEVPKVTHSLVSLFNDPEVKPNCSILVSKRGSVTQDFGKNQSYGVRRHYREFEITCSHYIIKDQLEDTFLDTKISYINLKFNCEEQVYY